MSARHAAGERPRQIADALGRDFSRVQRVIRQRGGVHPRRRERAVANLLLAEWERISHGLVAGESLRTIAAAIDPFSREVDGGSRWPGHLSPTGP
jgi:hypothetical protein